MWAGLGFAKLGFGVWLRPVPRMLLGAGFRRGWQLRGLAVVVGKNTAGLLLLLLFVEGRRSTWLAFSLGDEESWVSSSHSGTKKRDPSGSRCGFRFRW